MSERKTYRATVRRDGRWWFIEVPGEQGLYSQARRLDQAEAMIREVIGLMRDVPEDTFDVEIELPAELRSQANHLRVLRTFADSLAVRAAVEQRKLATTLHEDQGWSVRDIGDVLGVSHQRVAQLLATPAPVPAALDPDLAAAVDELYRAIGLARIASATEGGGRRRSGGDVRRAKTPKRKESTVATVS